jgi:hypothetical protein
MYVEQLSMHFYLSDDSHLHPLEHRELVLKFSHLLLVVDTHEDTQFQLQEVNEPLVLAEPVECLSKDVWIIHLVHVSEAVLNGMEVCSLHEDGGASLLC